MNHEDIKGLLDLADLLKSDAKRQAFLKDVLAKLEDLAQRERALEADQRDVARQRAEISQERHKLEADRKKIAGERSEVDGALKNVTAKEQRLTERLDAWQAEKAQTEARYAEAARKEQSANEKMYHATRMLADARAIRDEYEDKLSKLKKVTA